MNKFNAGDVYQLKFKPWKEIEPRGFEASKSLIETYKQWVERVWMEILVLSYREKHQRLEVFFLATNYYTAVYEDWLAEKKFIERIRDISEWPESGRIHFLASNGASIGDSKDNIKGARESIARLARIDRLQKNVHDKDPRYSMFDDEIIDLVDSVDEEDETSDVEIEFGYELFKKTTAAMAFDESEPDIMPVKKPKKKSKAE